MLKRLLPPLLIALLATIGHADSAMPVSISSGNNTVAVDALGHMTVNLSSGISVTSSGGGGGGTYNLTPPTLTSGATSPLQLDAVGSLRVSAHGVSQSGAWTNGISSGANTVGVTGNRLDVNSQQSGSYVVTPGTGTFAVRVDTGSITAFQGGNWFPSGEQMTSYAPDPLSVVISTAHFRFDAGNSLQVRAQILTDEDSFRDDFLGTSLPGANWASVTSGGGSTIVVANSTVTVTAGTGSSAKAQITQVLDYGPFQINFLAAVSQRIANQTAYLSVRDNLNNPSSFVEFQFSGTSSSTVVLVSGSDTASAGQQSSTVTIPGGGYTNAFHLYTADVQPDRVTFSIDSIVVGVMQTHIPGPYDVLTAYIAEVNSAVTASTTSLNVDLVYFNNVDEIQVQNKFSGNPLAVSFLEDVHTISGKLTTSATTADQTVLSFTVPAGKTLYIIGYSVDDDNVAASVVKIGKNSITTEPGTPGTGDSNIFRAFHSPAGTERWEDFGGNPRRFAVGGDVVKIAVTPSAITSTNWRASLDYIFR